MLACTRAQEPMPAAGPAVGRVATDGVHAVPLPPHGTGSPKHHHGGSSPKKATAGEALDGAAAKAADRQRRKEYREQAWKEAVDRCELFIGKTAAELEFISQSTQVLKYKAGDSIYLEGDPILPGCFFYLVHSGSYAALLKSAGGGEWVAREYGALDNFGACELLTAHGGGRVCTMRALTAGVLWGVPKNVVEQKLRIVSPKIYERNAPLVDFCLANVSLFKGVSRDRMGQLMRGAISIKLAPNERLVEEGDPARELFLVREGTMSVFKEGTDLDITMYAPAFAISLRHAYMHYF